MTGELDRYTCRATWSVEAHEHVALYAALPSLSWLEKTPEETRTTGVSPKQRLSAPRVSGRFTGCGPICVGTRTSRTLKY